MPTKRSTLLSLKNRRHKVCNQVKFDILDFNKMRSKQTWMQKRSTVLGTDISKEVVEATVP